MRASLKVVTQLPLIELWRDSGVVASSRGRSLSRDDIKSMFHAGSVQFVVADVGASLRWILLNDCYNFWKLEVQPHLADPEAKACLDNFPNGYCYFVSEWNGPDGAPIVVCEKHH